MPQVMTKKLAINNLQIIDVTSNPDTFPTTLKQGRNYELRICVKNTDDTDTYWYDNVQLRVVPKNSSIQFFADTTYSTSTFRFGSPLFKLTSTDSRWFIIPLRGQGNRPVEAQILKFDIGLYAHEQKIDNKWKKLNNPI